METTTRHTMAIFPGWGPQTVWRVEVGSRPSTGASWLEKVGSGSASWMSGSGWVGRRQHLLRVGDGRTGGTPSEMGNHM